MIDYIKNNTKKITVTLMVSTIVLWILWDIYVATNTTVNEFGETVKVLGDTESETTRDAAFLKWPSIASFCVMLLIHFFVPREHSQKQHTRHVIYLIIISLGLVTCEFFDLLPVFTIFGSKNYGLIPYMLLGIPMGLLWQQRPPKELSK